MKLSVKLLRNKMSKVGEKPLALKEGTIVTQEGGFVVIKGPLGQMRIKIPSGITLVVDKEVQVKRNSDEKKVKSVHGTMARLIKNAIEGTTNGFSKSLEVVGTGYWAKVEGNNLVLALGFSHHVNFSIPEGVKIEAKENKITVFGVDKELVGTEADKIKKIRKPDSYKGKGIRYLGEKLRLKPGKLAAKVGTTGAK